MKGAERAPPMEGAEHPRSRPMSVIGARDSRAPVRPAAVSVPPQSCSLGDDVLHRVVPQKTAQNVHFIATTFIV